MGYRITEPLEPERSVAGCGGVCRGAVAGQAVRALGRMFEDNRRSDLIIEGISLHITL